MNRVISAEKFITIGTRGQITSIGGAYPSHVLAPGQLPITDDEDKLLRACNGDLQKAKNIIKALEIKIKKGSRNGK